MEPPRAASWWRWPDASACRYIISGWAKARTICNPSSPRTLRGPWWVPTMPGGQHEPATAAARPRSGPPAHLFCSLQVGRVLRGHGRLYGGHRRGAGAGLCDREKNIAHAAVHRRDGDDLRRPDLVSGKQNFPEGEGHDHLRVLRPDALGRAFLQSAFYQICFRPSL